MPMPIISCTRLNCARFATGPCVVCCERGSPTTKLDAASSASRSTSWQALAGHDHARRRAAGLADIAEAGRHACRHGTREVRIRQDHVGRFAAEFLGHALHRRGGRLGHQHAGPRRTGDRDHVHVRMRRQGGADLRPIAVHQVEHTRRDAGVVHHFGKEQGAQGRQLAGLQHDRASRCQGGSDLGGDLVERPVPGRDQAAHADGLAHDGHVAPMGDERIAGQIVAGHADVLGRRRHLRAARKADGRAHLQRDRLGEQFRALEDQGMDAIEKQGPALGGTHGPGREGAPRRSHGCSDVSSHCPARSPRQAPQSMGRRRRLRACVSGTTHSPPMNARSRRPALLRCSMMEEFTGSASWKRREGCSLPSMKAWPWMHW